MIAFLPNHVSRANAGGPLLFSMQTRCPARIAQFSRCA